MATPGASVGNNALITPGGAQGPVGAAGNPGAAGTPGGVGPTGPQGSSVNYKGTVATSSALPPTGNTADLWLASDTGHGWIWSGGGWKDSGPWQGPPGPSGTPGINAGSTTTTQAMTVPPVGQTVTVTVNNASWIQPGQMLAIAQAGGPNLSGSLQVTAINGNQLTLLNPVPPPAIPLADNTQPGLLTQVSNLTTDFVDGTNHTQDLATAVRPTIYSVRLRNWNSIGNCSFEVDQRNVGNSLTNPAAGAFIQDRWALNKSGTLTAANSFGRQAAGPILIPGTNFCISQNFLRVTLTTAQASLAAGDYLYLLQFIEGPLWRELSTDVHSVSLLVRSSVANLKFGLGLADSPATKSLVNLCSLAGANTWTLIPLANLPVWPSGNFTAVPGSVGYILSIALACGTTYTTSANGAWAGMNAIGAIGQSNWAASPVNSTFDIAFIQHEPGPLCTTLQDLDWLTNYERCLRYFSKTFDYGIAPGGAMAFNGAPTFGCTNTTTADAGYRFAKTMAKAPTVTFYHPQTGAINQAYDLYAGAVFSGIGSAYVSQTGVLRITGTGFTTGHWICAHFTADTGW